MKLKDMEKEELQELIRETVADTIYHLIGDLDEGKKVKGEVKKKNSINP